MVRHTTKRLAGAGALIALLATMSACDTIGNPMEVLGKKPSPDEFQVIARKPLKVPGASSLPEPQPGVSSPLEPDPQRDAVVALFGEIPEGSPTTVAISAGENELLSAVDAAAAEQDIRQALAIEEQQIQENKPYEPPTVSELLTGSDDLIDEEDVLDSRGESRRLQSEGIAAAPIDPLDRPETPRIAQEQETDGLEFPETVGGRPKAY